MSNRTRGGGEAYLESYTREARGGIEEEEEDRCLSQEEEEEEVIQNLERESEVCKNVMSFSRSKSSRMSANN